MSAPVSNSRTRRGRVLVVGEIPGLSDTSLMEHQLFASARNLFDALGEVAVATSGQPIVTVVLPARFIVRNGNAIPASIEAFRRIDPSVRIIAAVEQDSGNDGWQPQGVDDVIQIPVDEIGLEKLIEEDLFVASKTATRKAHPIQMEVSRQTEPTAAAVQEPVRVSQITPSPSPIPTPESPRTPDVPLPRIESPLPAQSNSNEPIGDTDLIEAVLQRQGRVLDLALRAIMQQTHWTDLQFDGDISASSSPPKSTCVVELHQRQFGMLATSQASSEQLQPWAAWLARWLLLDAHFHEHKLSALQDELTGAGNRRFFEQFLREAIARAAKARRPVTLMVFDIDNFKSFNDQFGHDAGDDILREAVRLMQTVIRQGDRVCRIGGDEFAVVFADDEAPREPGSKQLESVESIAKRFQDQICKMKFPKLGAEAPGTLTISAGLATYPWDGIEPEALLRHADQLALESKRKGKNIITFGLGALRACRDLS